MSNLPSNNRLSVLAADIQAAHQDVTRGALAIAESAMAAGRMLIEAKASMRHGEWATWLSEHVGMSARTARRYMQLARSSLETATVADLGLRGAAENLARRTDNPFQRVSDLLWEYGYGGGMDAELAALPDKRARIKLLRRILDDTEVDAWIEQIQSRRRMAS